LFCQTDHYQAAGLLGTLACFDYDAASFALFVRFAVCLFEFPCGMSHRSSYDFIRSSDELADYCRDLASAASIAVDTEFVSEDCYRPQLCLLQVASRRGDQPARLAIVDPLAISDVTPFWEVVARGQHETIVHAGRQEWLFCWQAAGAPPARLLDVQVAAGLAGGEYPSSYASLISRWLGKHAQKGETRTNWRRRPLSARQLDYALDDVRYLFPLRDVLIDRLASLGRDAWIVQEMVAWQAAVKGSLGDDQWRRLAGGASLSRRELAIVRELWRWREELAEQRNQPPRRMLRDDLIVELARRATSDPARIAHVRGFERRDYQKLIAPLAERIERALELPDDACPRPPRREEPGAKRIVLGQFLAAALAGLCREVNISPGLLGGPGDVRDLIAWRLGERDEAAPPALAVGWRAEVIGRRLDELLEGKLSVHIHDAAADQPLAFEQR
jgi:ribonuclease D